MNVLALVKMITYILTNKKGVNCMFLKGDFHIHSNYSDGKLSINKIIDLYKEKNYDVISITDHDTMEGCKEAIEYGKKHSLKVIPGIEVSTIYNGEEIHILGYFRYEDYQRKEMVEYANEKQQYRINRCKNIVNALKKYFNIEINAEELLAQNKGMIGRPHIGRAIIKAGYEDSMDEVFKKYLNYNSPAYIPSSFLSLKEGVDLLKNNNAIVVLAHPIFIIKSKIEYLLSSFKFDGMEAIYGMNSKEDTVRFTEICKSRGLLITAGSDFHEFNSYKHANIGDISLDEENIKKLLNKLE